MVLIPPVEFRDLEKLLQEALKLFSRLAVDQTILPSRYPTTYF